MFCSSIQFSRSASRASREALDYDTIGFVLCQPLFSVFFGLRQRGIRALSFGRSAFPASRPDTNITVYSLLCQSLFLHSSNLFFEVFCRALFFRAFVVSDTNSLNFDLLNAHAYNNYISTQFARSKCLFDFAFSVKSSFDRSNLRLRRLLGFQ